VKGGQDFYFLNLLWIIKRAVSAPTQLLIDLD